MTDAWAAEDAFNPRWAKRAEAVASLILPRSSVLDLGCGQMHLRNLLPEDCTYHPADLQKWADDVVVCDLDAGQFPAGRFDVVAIQGVLEYLKRPGEVLALARQAAPRLVLTYFHPLHVWSYWKNGGRRSNYISRKKLGSMLRAAGYTIEQTSPFNVTGRAATWLYACK
jgi:hypothetical protein